MKIRFVPAVLLTFALATPAFGQSGGLFGGCQNSNSAVYGKLVCQFPFSVGLYNNATALGNFSTQPNAAVIATIFNSAIATQVSQLPVSTATAGTVLLYENGSYTTYHNQGPILTDRPQTVGRNHFFLGYSASEYVFNAIDGQSLGSLQFAYSRTAANGTTTFTSEQTKLSFRLTQHVIIGTYGFTDRFDVSAIVPFERVAVGTNVTSNENWVVPATSGGSFGPYSTSVSPTKGSATGVGDVTINLKYLLWNGAKTAKSAANQPTTSHAGRTAIAAGVNVREPLGDDLNLLGSGAFGINPYLVASYLSVVSPHAKIGYQWNSTTELNPLIQTQTTISSTGVTTTQSTSTNQALPGGLNYDIGADWAATKQVTIAVDLLGNQYLNSTVLSSSQTTISLTNPLAGGGGCSTSTSTSANLVCSSTTYNISSYTVNKISTGVKWNLVRDFVISANLLTQLNNNGLRSRPVPLLGISYKF